MKIYSNAFRKHDKECYDKWLSDVLKGEAKLNSDQLQPHEIAKGYINWPWIASTCEDDLLNNEIISLKTFHVLCIIKNINFVILFIAIRVLT